MTDDQDLELVAVRYISGELSAAEFAAFEQRLAEDQGARDAVEFAVHVATAAATESRVAIAAAPLRSFRRRAARWAAAVVVVGCGLAWSMWRDDAAEAPDRQSPTAEQAAVEAEESAAEVLIASWVAFGELDGEESSEELAGDFDVDTTEVAYLNAGAAPAWMMQGLSK